MPAIINFLQQTGFYMFGQDGNGKCLIMIAISFILMYLAIVKGFEPLLLLPISFGMLCTNLPGADDGDNAADSDTVIDYSEATPPSDTDPVDPNYTLSPSQEPAQSADLSTPDESSTAAQDTAWTAPRSSAPAWPVSCGSWRK